MSSTPVAPAVLLASNDPSVRCLTLVEVLGLPAGDPEVVAARAAISEGPQVRALLSGQQPDGGFGVHPYRKWIGAHWRLVSLVELAVPPGFPPAVAAAEGVLEWLDGRRHLASVREVEGLTRRCASQEGNALAVACRLGLAGDVRVEALAGRLRRWQWPDGGWNCDVRLQADHASFHESLAPLWGLIEHHRATGHPGSRAAADRTAELLLRHRLFRSDRTGRIIRSEWLRLHYPPYWHYDTLQALLVLGRGGYLPDARAEEALDRLEAKRLPEGTWPLDAVFWSPPGQRTRRGPRPPEVVDWGRVGEPNEMVTLNALRALRAAGRL